MSAPLQSNDRFAPEGYVWICPACAKTQTDRHAGDASCWSWVHLFRLDDVLEWSADRRRVVKMKPGAVGVHWSEVKPPVDFSDLSDLSVKP